MDESCHIALGELLSVKHGFAFKGEYFVDQNTTERLVTPGNFAIGGGFQEGKPKHYRGPVEEEYVLRPGDLLVTMTDLSKAGDTLGYPAIVPQTQGFRYLHNQRIGLIQIHDSERLDWRYLYYRLCSADYRHHVLASATGSTVRHTSPSRIGEFELDLPPIEAQRAIAAVLGSLDDKIEVSRRTARVLEGIARTIFRSWFVDFDPVRNRQAASAAGQPTALPDDLAALFPTRLVDSPLGDIPEGWEVRPLDSIARFLNGLALQKYPPRDAEPTLPVIKIAQLRKGDTVGADLANTEVPEDYVVRDGDMLFSWSGSLQCVLWAGGEGALNQHLFKVTSDEFPQWFVYLWVQHHLPEFRRIAAAKATTMGHIQRQHLTQALVAVPPRSALVAMNELLGPIVATIPLRFVQSRGLARIRDALLPRLVSGDLEVPLSSIREARQ